MADAIIGDTQLEPSKQELIMSIVQRELKFSAKLSPIVRDLSAFAIPGHKSIEFPKMGSFTVINRTSGAAGDAEAVPVTTDVMDLDQNAYVAWLVDSSDEVQSRIAVQAELAGRAASAHGRFMDSAILTEASAVAGLNINGGAPADITLDDVLDMREYILDNEGVLEKTWLVVGSDQEKVLLKIPEFSRNDIYGQSVIPRGFLGNLYGVNVMIHNGVAAQQAYMWEMDGLGMGLQSGPNLTDQGANEFGANARRFAMDQLFGVKGLQVTDATITIGSAPLGTSALVAKLAD